MKKNRGLCGWVFPGGPWIGGSPPEFLILFHNLILCVLIAISPVFYILKSTLTSDTADSWALFVCLSPNRSLLTFLCNSVGLSPHTHKEAAVTWASQRIPQEAGNPAGGDARSLTSLGAGRFFQMALRVFLLYEVGIAGPILQMRKPREREGPLHVPWLARGRACHLSVFPPQNC